MRNKRHRKLHRRMLVYMQASFGSTIEKRFTRKHMRKLRKAIKKYNNKKTV